VIFTGEWSVPVKEAAASNSLIDQGINVMTCHVDSPKVVMETAERRGIFACGYHANQSKLAPEGYLTGAEWNWITVYQQFIADAQGGKPIPNFTRGGLSKGFVKIKLAPRLKNSAGSAANVVIALGTLLSWITLYPFRPDSDDGCHHVTGNFTSGNGSAWAVNAVARVQQALHPSLPLPVSHSMKNACAASVIET